MSVRDFKKHNKKILRTPNFSTIKYNHPNFYSYVDVAIAVTKYIHHA